MKLPTCELQERGMNMKDVAKVIYWPTVFLLSCSSTFAQTPTCFFPYSAGNVWQYRDALNNQVSYTRYNDSTWISGDANVIISGRRVPGSSLLERIDTADNVFNLQFQSAYPRYKLAADSGDSWIAGMQGNDPVAVTVTNVFQGYVFGVLTTVKVFRFELVLPSPQPPFWLGDDYLARGFGLVQSRIEPTLNLYLAGAIIDSIQWGVIVDVEGTKTYLTRFALRQNYPNPFNPSTQISYSTPRQGNVELKIYDVLGREISTLVHEKKQPGEYTVEWNAVNVPSGVYFYRLVAGDFVQTKKMILMR